jgi:hypothetical protein
MKNKILKTMLALAMVVTVTVGGMLPISAAPLTRNSDVSVTVVEGDVAPPDDLEDADPEEVPGGGPGTTDPEDVTGSFALLYVPVEFNFADIEAGSFTTSALNIAIDPTKESATGTNPTTKDAAVADLRGSREGWKLTGTLSELKDEDTNKVLTGASITATSELFELAADWSVNAPNATEAPTAPTALTFEADTEALVMGAAVGVGQGLWNARMTDVTLVIPAATANALEAGDNYTGTILWTLSDVPL